MVKTNYTFGSGDNATGIIGLFNILYKKRLYQYIEAFSTSYEWTCVPNNVITNGASYFHSDRNNLNQQYLWIHFKRNRIIPHKYKIKSYYHGPGTANLKKWEMEGSNDGIDYETIAKVDYDDTLNCGNCQNIFDFDETNKEFSFIRLKFIENHCNDEVSNRILAFSKIEIYGTVTNRLNIFSCKFKGGVSCLL